MRYRAPLVILLFAAASLPISGQEEKFKAAGSGAIADQYMVVLEESAARLALEKSAKPAVTTVIEQLQVGRTFEIKGIWEHALRGFKARMSEQEARKLAKNPLVKSVEQDYVVAVALPGCGEALPLPVYRCDQTPETPLPPSPQCINCPQGHETDDTCQDNWGLDRIDQPSGRDGNFAYSTNDSVMTGAGVHIYFVDKGVRAGHQEFPLTRFGESGSFINGQTTGGGPDAEGKPFEEGCPHPSSPYISHGTHVAAIAAGLSSGVAKQATLHSIRIMKCDGVPVLSRVVDALNWIGARHPAHTPGVVNMSFYIGSEGGLDALRNALLGLVKPLGTPDTRTYRYGMLLVASANNQNHDAAETWPAGFGMDPTFVGQGGFLIVVGSTNGIDQKSATSNFGTVVDLFAPGENILSASGKTDDGYCVFGGTSMAAPLVSGVAATYLQRFPGAEPQKVEEVLKARASAPSPPIDGTQSPNRLLYSNMAAPAADFSSACTSLTCTFTASDCNLGQNPCTYTWSFGGSTRVATYTFPTFDSHPVTLTVKAPDNELNTQTKTITLGPPVVVTPPVDRTVCVGTQATFSVQASPPAQGPFGYTWQEKPPGASDFTSIPGNTATLTLPSVTLAISGTFYRCLVSYPPAGQITSGSAKLTVEVAPTITQAPASQRVNVGSTVTFSVAATGIGPITYQWKKNAAVIGGATSSTLTLANVTDSNEGSYTVTVGDACNSTTSAPANLTVVNLPVVTQPQNTTVPAGGTATFQVVITSPSGDGPYQPTWQQRPPGTSSFVGMPGQTSLTLTLANVTPAMSGTAYRCLVGNQVGQINSGPGVLTVSSTAPPTIVQGPVNQKVNVNSNVTFTVTANGTLPLSYAWKKNGGVISGATAATLTLNGVTDANEGSYTVTVSNAHGSATSAPATLTVVNKPVVTAPPSVTVHVDEPAAFTISATPTVDGPFTYAWQQLVPGATTFGGVPNGPNGPRLEFTRVTIAMNGTKYRCLVSNSAGQSNSGPATLTVNP